MTNVTSAARRRIATSIAGLRSDIVDLACRLIAIPTESPPGRSYAECADLLGDTLRRLDVPCDNAPAPEGRYVVVAGFGRGPTVYLHGHYDVVPAVNAAQFRAVVDGNRLVGRGSADMKGAIAAMVYALRRAVRPGSTPGREDVFANDSIRAPADYQRRTFAHSNGWWGTRPPSTPRPSY